MNAPFLLRFGWLLAGLLAAAPLAMAQSPALTLTGKIVDKTTGEPLPAATVQVLGERKMRGTLSNGDGEYRLEIAQPEFPLRLVASFVGYRSDTVLVPQQTGASLVVDFSLIAATATLDDVVITAGRGLEQRPEDVTMSIEVIKQKSINLQAAYDATRVLTQASGVDVLDGQVNIRGSSGYAYGVGSRVMVMLNGLPLLSGDASSPPLQMLPVDNISRVEIMKGASSVLYGSAALGGVINIITAEPDDKPQTVFRLKQTVFGAPRNAALDWDGGKAAYVSSAHAFHARKFTLKGGGKLALTLQGDYADDSGYRQRNGRKTTRGFAMLSYRPASIKGLDMGLNLSTQKDSSISFLYWNSYYPYTTGKGKPSLSGDTVYSQGALTPGVGTGITRRQSNLRYTADPYIRYVSPKGNVLWYRGRIFSSDFSSDAPLRNRTSLLYNDVMYQTLLWKHVSWTSGITQTATQVKADSLYGKAHTGNSVGVYTQADAKLGRWNLNAGARLESVRVGETPRQTQPVFRGGANFQVAEGTNLRASVGQAFRVPSVAELYTNTVGGSVLVEPNPELRAETGYSAEIGIKQGFRFGSGRWRLQGFADIAAFSMRYHNMVEFGINRPVSLGDLLENKPVPFSSKNLAEARINGAELTANMQFTSGKWEATLSGGITYLDPRNLLAVPDSNQFHLEGYDALVDSVNKNPANLIKALFDPNSVLNQLGDSTRSDVPSVLKYRSRWTTRVSATVGYGAVSLSANYRYQSNMENIDQFLYLVVRDLYAFRQQHNRGNSTLDLIATVRLNARNTLSLNVDNALNAEYMVIPGYLAEQRRYTLQYIWRF